MSHLRRLVAGVLAMLVLAACASPDPSVPDGRLRVVATTTAVGSVASEIGGDEIALTVLLAPGVEAHDFELTPQAAAAIEDADLILVSGAGLEAWLADTLATIGADATVADLSDGIELRRTDDGEVDPHYWLSGPRAMRMVENARDALADADPAHADGVAARTEALLERLRDADAEARAVIDGIPAERRGIVTNHDALGYFIDEYGLRHVASIFPSLDVSSEPNPAQLAELIDLLRAEGVTAIFSESAVVPELARTIAAETGARVVEEPLYTDALGPPGSGVETLDAMLVHNARVIRDGLLP